jgi:ferredoxin-type protein NapH
MKKIKASQLRSISIFSFIALTLVGLRFKSGTGGLCALGIRSISLICPLGSIESIIASRTFIPLALISLAVIALLSTILGRIFCAWMCPVPTVRSWILGSPKKSTNGDASPSAAASNQQTQPSEFHPEGSKISLDSRHFVLGGAIISSAIFGFPVFCLICPVGLIMATLVGIWRLFQFNEPSWSLLIFPAVVVFELVALKKWCRKICPLGALASLLSALNIFARPKVNPEKCVRSSKGMDCSICKNACPEEIDLHHVKASQPLSECTKCRECAEQCPSGAISFPFRAQKQKEL